jgi:hypothetical protein
LQSVKYLINDDSWCYKVLRDNNNNFNKLQNYPIENNKNLIHLKVFKFPCAIYLCDKKKNNNNCYSLFQSFNSSNNIIIDDWVSILKEVNLIY